MHARIVTEQNVLNVIESSFQSNIINYSCMYKKYIFLINGFRSDKNRIYIKKILHMCCMDLLEKFVSDVQSSAEQVNDIDRMQEILDMLEDREQLMYIVYTTENCD